MTRGAFSSDYTWKLKALSEMALILIMPLPKPTFFSFQERRADNILSL